jgi:hypothetical protein
VATLVDDNGWSAEARIPLSQLRFDAGADRHWGLNIVRRVPDRNATSYWVLVGREENGWSSRMGRLAGLGTLRAPARVELLPYIAVEGTRFGEVDSDDPFSRRTSSAVRLGGDLKVGLGSSLTLDATINPDFGQVEADPAEVNLSAFETFFDERRPFFIEGSNLFGGRNTFYSRRIGAPPPGDAEARYAEPVGNTTILGAAKVTGRLPGGLSVGALGAVTAEETVRTLDPDLGTGAVVVAPVTAYGIVTAQQELGRDRSTIKASFTAVDRDLAPGSGLERLLPRRAVTGLLDGRWRWSGGAYDISAYAVVSRVEGDTAAIARLQRAPGRYFQRPDASHLRFDPSRTVLSGWRAGINHSKLAGSWLWDIDYEYLAPGLEVNDIGFQNRVDYQVLSAQARHRQTTPGKLLHQWTAGAAYTGVWNTAGVATFAEYSTFGILTLKDFSSLEWDLEYSPSTLDDGVTRGGPLGRAPSEWRLDLDWETSSQRSTLWSVGAGTSTDGLGGWELYLSPGIRVRLGTRWQLSFEPYYARSRTSRQYVGVRGGGPTATFGGRYLFGEVERSEVSAQFRAAVAITPDLSLEGYVEPFAASGQYSGFGELVAAGDHGLRRYGTDGTSIALAEGRYSVSDGDDSFAFGDPDFNVRSFRSNLVLRWEWLPGSTAYLVWQQDRSARRDEVSRVGPRGLLDAFTAPGNNVLAVKVSYWLAR